MCMYIHKHAYYTHTYVREHVCMHVCLYVSQDELFMVYLGIIWFSLLFEEKQPVHEH